jgi:6-phosphogluconolactonase (cycloisomerase 2 family)
MLYGRSLAWSILAVAAASLAAPLQAQFVYVTNFGSNDVSAYSIGATGTLTPVPGSPFAAGANPVSAAVDPSGKFLYVANGSELCPACPGANTVSAYTIGATGALTPIAGSPFAAGAGPFSVAVDPTGRFVYVANQFSANVSAYSINGATGALTPISGSPFAAGTNPFSVVVHPTGKFLYVVNIVSGNVSAYSINAATGALTPISGSPFGAGHESALAAVSPSGLFYWVPNFSDNNIQSYSVNVTTGALTSLGVTTSSGSGPTSVAVDPTGSFVYVTDQFSGDVSAYLGAAGLLVANGSPATGAPATRFSAVDPSGRFLYTSNFTLSGTVTAYSIGATGTLTLIGTVSAGSLPASVAITPKAPACPLGQGFWKNHPEDWPVTTLTIGGTAYTEAQLATVLKTKTKGDAVLILTRELIAAELNIANGSNGSSVTAVIADANSLLAGINLLAPKDVDTNTVLGQKMVAAAAILESFNEGNLTPNCTAKDN